MKINDDKMAIMIVCLFDCFEPHRQFFRYLAAVTITGDRAANLDVHLCLALPAFSRAVLLRATPTATRDLFLRSYQKDP
jgi:hypothetical protein